MSPLPRHRSGLRINITSQCSRSHPSGSYIITRYKFPVRLVSFLTLPSFHHMELTNFNTSTRCKPNQLLMAQRDHTTITIDPALRPQQYRNTVSQSEGRLSNINGNHVPSYSHTGPSSYYSPEAGYSTLKCPKFIGS